MAQKTIVQFTDDLDGSEASQTVEFGYQGKTYKLDLNDRNAAELEEALAPYIAAAQRADGGRGRGGRRGKTRTPAASQQRSGDGRNYDSKAVRQWAQSQGLEVPARGRIPGKVLEQFKAAQS